MPSARSIAEPSACGHCGIPRGEHAQRWHREAGWHQWTAPTNEQIKTRMQQRRANRTTSREG